MFTPNPALKLKRRAIVKCLYGTTRFGTVPVKNLFGPAVAVETEPEETPLKKLWNATEQVSDVRLAVFIQLRGSRLCSVLSGG